MARKRITRSGGTHRKVKWGHLSEIDYRTRVGSPTWHNAHPNRIRKLSAWRYLHTLGHGHKRVRKFARKHGHNPSTRRLTVQGMLKIAGEMKKRK